LLTLLIRSEFWKIYSISRTFALEIAVRRERGRSLLLLYPMSSDALIHNLEQRINALISAEQDLFLVEIKIKPTNNIKIYIDGDQGISIDKLVQYNRRLYRQLEEEGMFPGGDFSLEVSSPGLDEPLRLHRQYVKNIGRFVEIIDNEGFKKEGKLIEVDEKGIKIEDQKTRMTGKIKKKEAGQQKGKKMEVVEYTIPFEQIKATKIQIKF
jgi:ribosome maturation factor RimP